MSEPLLPCPFCGAEAEKCNLDYFVVFNHKNCPILGSQFICTYPSSVEQWNRRAPDPALAGLIEAANRLLMVEDDFAAEGIDWAEEHHKTIEQIRAALEAARKGTT